MTRTDLTVRGAGAFGLAIAWAAARRGARVRLVETARIGAGASGGLVGALAPHVPENWNEKKAFQLDSLLMAADWWAEVARCGGKDPGYARSGRLQPLADAHAVEMALARQQTAEELWRGQARWQVLPARAAAIVDYADWQPRSATGLWVHDTLSARLHPRRAAAALIAALAARDAEIVIGTEIVIGAGIVIGTEALAADDHGPVVWATGTAGLEMISADLGCTVGSGVKGQALLLDLDRRTAPQLFADTIHFIPHIDGTLAIGSTSENEWADPSATDAQLDALLARATAACPSIAGARVIERWAGLRPRSRSRSPMLGAWPGRPGHFIANGGFKIGFGMAPKVAETLVDLILDGHDTIPPGFRVEANLPKTTAAARG
jgi:glycine oxidase